MSAQETAKSNSNPFSCQCPNCKDNIVTKTQSKKGGGFWASVVGCSFIACCCIPFCTDTFNDVVHSCPKCGITIGTKTLLWFVLHVHNAWLIFTDNANFVLTMNNSSTVLSLNGFWTYSCNFLPLSFISTLSNSHLLLLQVLLLTSITHFARNMRILIARFTIMQCSVTNIADSTQISGKRSCSLRSPIRTQHNFRFTSSRVQIVICIKFITPQWHLCVGEIWVVSISQ